MDAFAPLPDATLIRLVNKWGTTPRRLDPGAKGSLPPVSDLLDATPPIATASVEHAIGDATPDDLAAAADTVFAIFEPQPDAQRVRALNGLLRRTAPTPQLDLAVPHGMWTVQAPSDRPLAAAVLALVSHLRNDGGGDRLGVCSAERCADVYIDGSPRRHKRFCTVTCQNRTRVAAFRARRANEGVGAAVRPPSSA